MKRRIFIQLASATLLSKVTNAAPPQWSARLLKGGFDGTAWNAGFGVTLSENWKTYWRVPGDGGIAPAFEIIGSNIKSSRIDYPAPRRFRDAAGVTIGYKKEVVFPLVIEPENPLQPVSIKFSVFFGVCEVVCIPAQFADELSFDPAQSAAPDQIEISTWKKRVPVPKPQGVAAEAIEPIAKATVELANDKPVLKLDLAEAVEDVFVEGNPKHYFAEPSFAQGQATLSVHGAKTLEELRGERLRITLVTAQAALEQMVTVV
jgi:DsbC/DsbD-like thiol-disulfide interchange protein